MIDEARRLKFVLASMVLLFVLNGVGSHFHLGWPAITVNLAVLTVLDLVYVYRSKDRVFLLWMGFGLSAGIGELVADWWQVAGIETLHYPQPEPMIWVSPAYMPIAWMVVLVQIGAVGTWLAGRVSLLKASLATAALGGTSIPVYEHMAKGANWWYYQETPMIFNAPYYVVLAEALLALPLVWMMRRVAKSRPAEILGLGLVEAFVMLVACWIAWRLLGPCQGAVIQFACS